MRWFTFIILAYVMLGLQIGLGQVVGIGQSQINFVLIAATFIAINCHRNHAILGCFVLGLLQDLVSAGPVGTYAMAYSTMALMVAGTDRALAVEHPFTHFLVTFFGGLVVALIIWIHSKAYSIIHGTNISTALVPLLVGTFYTSLLSLPVLWILTRMRKAFKFRTAGGW